MNKLGMLRQNRRHQSIESSASTSLLGVSSVCSSLIGSSLVRITNLICPAMILLLLVMLSSCSGYNSSFGCPAASGLNCVPLSEVDRQIDSGEIEQVRKSKKCLGKYCSTIIKPDLRAPNIEPVILLEEGM